MFSAENPLTGRKFLALMVGAFAVVLAVNGVLVRLALSTHPGEVEHGAPPGGLRLMQVTPNDPRDPKWEVHVDQRGSTLMLDFNGPSTAELTVRALRPGDQGEGRVLALTRLGAHGFAVDASDLQSGQWDISVTAQDRQSHLSALRHGRISLP